MESFYFPMTVSGPFGQYTIEALVDPTATFSTIPTPALIEMGIQATRVVRLKAADGKVHFKQLGRALTTVGGQEDIAPVLFGEPGEPSVIGATTLSILLLRPDEDSRQMVSVEAEMGSG